MTLDELYRQHAAAFSDIKDHLPTFYDAVLLLNAQTVIELGVRSGVSTAAWLAALEQTGGRLWSCDIEDADVPHPIRTAAHWTMVVGDDLDVVDEAPRPADIVFIDTSHTFEQTLAELRAYVPLVRPGGVVMLHDTVSHPAVADAVVVFCDEAGLEWSNTQVCNGLGTIRCR